jgi:hypothetical protein
LRDPVVGAVKDAHCWRIALQFGVVLEQIEEFSELRRLLELGHVLDNERLGPEGSDSVEVVLPEPVEFGAGFVVPIAAERAEALAWWPTDDQVDLVRIRRTVLDVAGVNLTPEVPLEGLGRCPLVFDGEHRRVAQVGEVEPQRKPSRHRRRGQVF